jgi:hypothetical protein
MLTFSMLLVATVMPPQHRDGVLVVGGILFAAGSLILVGGGRSIVRGFYHRFYWIRTQAVIVESSKEFLAAAADDTDSDGVRQNLWLTVCYRAADGREYRSGIVGNEDYIVMPCGKSVTIRYHPKNPAQAAFEPANHDLKIILVLFWGGFLFGVGLLLLFLCFRQEK